MEILTGKWERQVFAIQEDTNGKFVIVDGERLDVDAMTKRFSDFNPYTNPVPEWITKTCFPE